MKKGTVLATGFLLACHVLIGSNLMIADELSATQAEYLYGEEEIQSIGIEVEEDDSKLNEDWNDVTEENDDAISALLDETVCTLIDESEENDGELEQSEYPVLPPEKEETDVTTEELIEVVDEKADFEEGESRFIGNTDPDVVAIYPYYREAYAKIFQIIDTYLDPEYHLVDTSRGIMTNEEYDALRSIAVNVTKGCNSDYEKAKAIFEYEAAEISYGAPESSNPYKILTTKIGNCYSYSYLYKSLLNSIGIPCAIVHGASTSAASHGYNLVYDYVAKRWYGVEVTWGSQTDEVVSEFYDFREEDIVAAIDYEYNIIFGGSNTLLNFHEISELDGFLYNDVYYRLWTRWDGGIPDESKWSFCVIGNKTSTMQIPASIAGVSIDEKNLFFQTPLLKSGRWPEVEKINLLSPHIDHLDDSNFGSRELNACLHEITLPASVVSIADNVFYGTPSDFTIRAPKGSYAETYAKAEGYGFVPIDENGNYICKDGHIPVNVAGSAATCTQTGLTEGQVCSRCGETIVSQTAISALGHSFGEWVLTTASTETTTGVETRTCGRCHRTETRSVPITKPSIDDSNVQGTIMQPQATTTLIQQGNNNPVQQSQIATKSDQPMVVKVKTPSVKASKIKKKSQTITARRAFSVIDAQGTLSYKKVSGNKKISINAQTGKITLKKGLKKKTSTIKVKVMASGNDYYNAGSRIVALKITVK